MDIHRKPDLFVSLICWKK